MHRYYFDVMDDRPLFDDEGLELADAAAARREATEYAIDLMAMRPREPAGTGAPGNVVVTDEYGHEVLKVTFPKAAAKRTGELKRSAA